jgi:hypothetical protein
MPLCVLVLPVLEGESGVEGDELLICKRDARRVRLGSERALPLLKISLVMQHFRTLTLIPVYSLKRASF